VLQLGLHGGGVLAQQTAIAPQLAAVAPHQQQQRSDDQQHDGDGQQHGQGEVGVDPPADAPTGGLIGRGLRNEQDSKHGRPPQ
jgi:hypothetical protein